MPSSRRPSSSLPATAEQTFAVRGDHIPLDALLKATGLAPSGGRAKVMIAEGQVQVDGHTELRKTCKLRPGQVVVLEGHRIQLTDEPERPAP